MTNAKFPPNQMLKSSHMYVKDDKRRANARVLVCAVGAIGAQSAT